MIFTWPSKDQSPVMIYVYSYCISSKVKKSNPLSNTAAKIAYLRSITARLDTPFFFLSHGPAGRRTRAYIQSLFLRAFLSPHPRWAYRTVAHTLPAVAYIGPESKSREKQKDAETRRGAGRRPAARTPARACAHVYAVSDPTRRCSIRSDATCGAS